jgi:hypothetical protein
VITRDDGRAPLRLRIATWNLQRPRRGSYKRMPGIRSRIADVDAAIWILTETNDRAVDLGLSHPHRVSSEPIAGLHGPGERWTTIWSKYPVEQVETYDAKVTACASVATPAGSILIYGTVLPWHAAKGPDGVTKSWAEFHRVLPLQSLDWVRLKKRFLSAPLCVAGDLNQSLDGRRWNGRQYYGSHATRAALRTAIHGAGLSAVTAHDLVEAGQLTNRSTIDHICLDSSIAAPPAQVGAWEAVASDGTALSDHNGVWADLSLPTS